MKGGAVSKEAKGSISFSPVANSNNANVKFTGLRVAASLKRDGAFPGDGYSGNDNTVLPKSTSVRGQDYPTADSVLPTESIIVPEISNAGLKCVADMFSDEDKDTEQDLDSPTEGFSSISEAIKDIQQGKVSIC